MRICRNLLYIRTDAEYNKFMEKIKFSKIWQYIEEHNYSLKQFRLDVGISKRELWKVLSGSLEFRFSSLMKIAKFFDIPVTWLFEGEEKEVQTSFYL